MRERGDWVAPSVTLRADQSFSFESRIEVGGAEFGVLTIPRRELDTIHIVDGQHRILGFTIALSGIRADRERARAQLQKVKRVDPDSPAQRDVEARLGDLDSQLARLERERIAVQLHVEPNPTRFRQMFYDIADNALNITASVRTRFDSTKVINRALPEILKHPLLEGRVELDVDRIGPASPMLLSAKNVAEITKNVLVGFSGRMGRRAEAQFHEDEVVDAAKSFFTVLVESFPPVYALLHGQITPQQLRKTSFLGSVVMLRILAGVYYELVTDRGQPRVKVREFFGLLAPHMSSDGSPIHPGSIWMEHANPEIFIEGAMSPRSRTQEQKETLAMLTDWAITRPAFLHAAPAPRPVEPDDDEEFELLPAP